MPAHHTQGDTNMRVRYKGNEYELCMHPSPRFADGPFLGAEIFSMASVEKFDGGKRSPPGTPLPELSIKHERGLCVLTLRDDFSKVEPMEMDRIRSFPNVVSRDGYIVMPVTEVTYCKELTDDLTPKPIVLD